MITFRSRFLTLSALFLAGVVAAQASGFTFTTIDEGSTDTSATGINNAGTVTGGHFGAATWYYTDSGGTFADIAVPGAAGVYNVGINNLGATAGTYAYAVSPGNYIDKGFINNAGVFTTIFDPNGSSTNVYSLNNSLEAVGLFYNSSLGYDQAFSYSGGVYTTITVPGEGSGGAIAFGVNNSGEVVGEYQDTSGGEHGFLDNGGVFTTLNVPGAGYTEALGINNVGQIVGTSSQGAFLYSAGVYSLISVPGSNFTQAFAINDSGVIVGNYSDSTGEFGFIATSVSGTPEPASWSLMLTASAMAGYLRMRRGRQPA